MTPDVTPLFVYIDQVLRVALILFLLVFSVKFKNWLMMIVLGCSSVTLYAVLRYKVDPDTHLGFLLVGEVIAFILVYMLYEYMRMKWVIRKLPTSKQIDDSKQGAMDVASNYSINQPNTRNQQIATRRPTDNK